MSQDNDIHSWADGDSYGDSDEGSYGDYDEGSDGDSDEGSDGDSDEGSDGDSLELQSEADEDSSTSEFPSESQDEEEFPTESEDSTASHNNLLGPLDHLAEAERLLLRALQYRDLAAVQQQLAAGADPAAADAEGRTALHLAAATCQGEAVAALVAAGADVSVRAHVSHSSSSAATPLQYMVMQARFPFSFRFSTIHKRFAPCNPDSLCSPQCHEAAAILQQLVAAGAQVNTVAGSFWRCTPLHDAAEAGCPTLVAALLQAGANPATTNEKCWSVLHAATRSGSLEVVQQVLGALGNSRAAEAVCALATERYGSMKQTPMHWPALEGHLKIAEVLVAAGANVNQQDSYGFTPLNRALQGGHCHLVSLLLTSANVNQEQPLHQAAVQPSKLQVQQHPERREQLITAAVAAVQALLAAGADTQSKDWKGRTPLAAALADGHRQVVQVLLRHELQQYKEQQHQQKHLGHGHQPLISSKCPLVPPVLQETAAQVLAQGDSRTWGLVLTLAADILGDATVHSLWGALKQQLLEQKLPQGQQKQQQGQADSAQGRPPYFQGVNAVEAWVECWAIGCGQLAAQRVQFTGRLEQLVVRPYQEHQQQQQQQQQQATASGTGRPTKRPRLARVLRWLGILPAPAVATGSAAAGPTDAGPVSGSGTSSSGGGNSSRITHARARDMASKAAGPTAAVGVGISLPQQGGCDSSTPPADALRDLEAAAASGTQQGMQAVLQQMPDRAAGLAAAAVTAAAVGRGHNWGLCMQLLRELVMLDEAKGRAAVHQVQLRAYAAARWRNQGHKAAGPLVLCQQSQHKPDAAGELAAALQVCDALLADWLAVRQQRVREVREAVVAAAGVAAAAVCV